MLRCKVGGNPRPVIAWSKDGEAIVPSERIQQVEQSDGTCELVINDPTPAESGFYKCTAGNKLETVEQEHQVCFLQAWLPINRRTSIGDHSKNAFGGGITTIKRSDATAAHLLLRGKKEVTQEEREEEERKKKAKGPYVRRHGVPSAEVWEQLTKHKLTFITHLNNRTIPAGQLLKLTCLVLGPEQIVTWSRNGKPLAVCGSRLRSHNRHGHCQLEILDCRPADAGEYTVHVHNHDCAVSSTCTVKVFATHLPSDLAPAFTRTLKCECHHRIIALSHIQQH